MKNEPSITALLVAWRQGDEASFEALSNQVYGELQRLARKYMRGERHNHTLQATALVNEAFAKLIDADISYENRAHFFAVAGRMMRRILVDHARALRRHKRGAGAAHVTLNESVLPGRENSCDVLDLHEALESLAAFDEEKAHILELQFFAGLKVREIAEVLDTPVRSIERDAQIGKAWLHRELS